jgi:hypothetical protein
VKRSGVVQRAPRLRPDQLLADTITRAGRFARIDPREGRRLPSLTHIATTAAWLGLMVQVFRRARAAAHPPARDAPESGDTGRGA